MTSLVIPVAFLAGVLFGLLLDAIVRSALVGAWIESGAAARARARARGRSPAPRRRRFRH